MYYHLQHANLYHSSQKASNVAVILILLCVPFLFIAIWWLLDQIWFNKDVVGNISSDDEAVANGSTEPIASHILISTTEADPKLVALYNFVRTRQIAPKSMERAKRTDLQFLAGMDYPHPDLAEPFPAFQPNPNKDDKEAIERERKRIEACHEELTKLMGNVSRAKAELNRRSEIRNITLAGTIGVVGTLIGVLIK